MMQCANCSEPAANACGNCMIAPVIDGDLPIVHYCSATCQKSDWTKHKPTCLKLKDRVTLYRVAGLTQKLFYIYQEVTWGQMEIKRILKRGNDLELRGRICRNVIWPVGFKPFPSALVKTPEDREAILTCLSGIYATGFTADFMAGLLDGIVTSSTKLKFETKGDLRRTRLYPDLFANVCDVCPSIHDVLKVTLRSGEVFVIDLAGAQFGHHEAALPWVHFQSSRIRKVLKTSSSPTPSGQISAHNYSLEQVKLAISMTEHLRTVRVSAHGHILREMEIALLKWELGERSNLKALWKMPEKEFLKKRDNLVNFVDWKFHLSCLNHFSTMKGKRLAKKIKGEWPHNK